VRVDGSRSLGRHAGSQSTERAIGVFRDRDRDIDEHACCFHPSVDLQTSQKWARVSGENVREYRFDATSCRTVGGELRCERQIRPVVV
jgi:hypothetical protein